MRSWSLLFHVKKRYTIWFKHLAGTPPKVRCFHHVLLGGDIGADLGQVGRIMFVSRFWEQLVVPLDEVQEVAGEMKVCATMLRL